MARKNQQPKGLTPVESTQHGDTRLNIPTADAHEWVDPQIEAMQKVTYQRDPTLDPQLIWKSKYEQDQSNLVADAPPIYIQEKIDPRALVENLRQTAKAGEPEPEATLFDDFDGLDPLDSVDFYNHGANWSNRMILGDSLQVMSSLAERESLRGQMQMVYIDPPYGIKFGSNWQVSARTRDVKDGKLDDAAREAEQIKAFRDTWELGIHSYLSYLRDRLMAARDLLTESGSCFVQIGDENVHLVRSIMDEVFGSENFVSQIAFKTTSGAGSFAGGTNVLAGVCDYVIWYCKHPDRVKYRQLYEDKNNGQTSGAYTNIECQDGTRRRATDDEKENGKSIFRLDNLTSQTTRVGQTTVFPVKYAGRTFQPAKGGWKTNQAGMERLLWANRIGAAGNTLSYVRFLSDFPVQPLSNLWDDTTTAGFGDPKLYVVQTNTKIVQRCMLMCTDPGDLVLDPTCGSGTTAQVAEHWGRRWITVDTSRVALALARQRLMGARFPYYLLADSQDGRTKEGELNGKPLPPTQTTSDIRHGFVYKRVQHITLKSIANNPDIEEGMTREQIDAAIKRHADYELLYDKPYEDKNKVRVSGKFTLESLSPHRSLAFAGSPEQKDHGRLSDTAADAEGHGFEQTILDNLTKAGIQNGKRAERIAFSYLDPYAGNYLQAVGERAADGDNAPGRVGVAIGPQYGTVNQAFIKDAAREAIRTEDIDLLCVLGFAFDPHATGVTETDGVSVEASDDGFASVESERKLGRIKVLFVRMNADLLFGGELQKTDKANLFTVFGEPDIEYNYTDEGQVIVDLHGVDVYDPTTGEVRSNDTGQVALWMIDTDYNEESFFVRHCYFTGGNDPYKRLKSSLKSEIDANAWATLYATQSRPFEKPETGKIAVKVINDYGDEVMKVFEV